MEEATATTRAAPKVNTPQHFLEPLVHVLLPALTQILLHRPVDSKHALALLHRILIAAEVEVNDVETTHFIREKISCALCGRKQYAVAGVALRHLPAHLSQHLSAALVAIAPCFSTLEHVTITGLPISERYQLPPFPRYIGQELEATAAPMCMYLELTVLESVFKTMSQLVEVRPDDVLVAFKDALALAAEAEAATLDWRRCELPTVSFQDRLAMTDSEMDLETVSPLLNTLARAVCAIVLQTLTFETDTARAKAEREKAEVERQAPNNPTTDKDAKSAQLKAALSDQLTIRPPPTF